MSQRRTLLETVLAEPERFAFDAAIAVLMQAAGRHGHADSPIRFRATTGLGFIASDIAAVQQEAAAFHLETGIIGLTGPSGVLPRPYTDLVNTERRERSPALAAFLDLLAQRPIAAFAAAGVKYQPHRAARMAHGMPAEPAPDDAAAVDGLRHTLLALAGYGTPHLAPRLAAGTDPLLFYAGLFAAHPRNADSLAAMISDWLGQAVVVEEFAGAWLEIGTATATALPRAGSPGQFNQLGVDAAIGTHYWDIQSRISLRIGPLPLGLFESLQPDQPLFVRLCSLVRAYLGPHLDFAINPVLAAVDVPAPALRAEETSRLGWNIWLPTDGGRRKDGTEPVFAADEMMPMGDVA